MRSGLKSLHARVLAHSTEDIDKVKLALANVIGPREFTTAKVEGIHGNPITVIEANTTEPDDISPLFSKMSIEDLGRLLGTLDQRIDEGCNAFVRIDKQRAYFGEIGLGHGDDVVAIRIRVAAFPAKSKVAKKIMGEVIGRELASRERPGHGTAPT